MQCLQIESATDHQTGATFKEEIITEELCDISENIEILEEEMFDGASNAVTESDEELEEFDYIEELSQDNCLDATFEEKVFAVCKNEIVEKAPREELRYDDDNVGAKFVLSAEFLKAREFLKANKNENNATPESLKYSKCNVVDESGEKILFFCEDPKCEISFQSEDEAKLHLDDHLKYAPAKLQCKYCPQSFRTRANYKNHLNNVHSGLQFMCQTCGETFETRIKWQSHSRNHDKTLKYHCTFQDCTKAFRVKHHLTNHLRSHTKESPFQCNFDGCSAAFRQRHALTIHIRKHTQEFFNCEQCKSPFVTQYSLNKHLKKCDGTYRPLITRIASKGSNSSSSPTCFSCCITNCGESFKAKATLEKHLTKVHQIEVTSTLCILCCQEFENLQVLKAHMRNHLPFSCEFCSVNFRTEENYNNHMMKNHDKDEVRLHHCTHCPASFKRAEHLRSHVAYKHTTERPFACDSCAYVSLTRYDLNVHMKHHMKEKDLSCQFCDFNSKKVATMKFHLKSIHNTDALSIKNPNLSNNN